MNMYRCSQSSCKSNWR